MRPFEMSETEKPTSTGALAPAELAPLGEIFVLDGLSGREGSNRSRSGHQQISASTDQEAVLAWLARFADSPNTGVISDFVQPPRSEAKTLDRSMT